MKEVRNDADSIDAGGPAAELDDNSGMVDDGDNKDDSEGAQEDVGEDQGDAGAKSEAMTHRPKPVTIAGFVGKEEPDEAAVAEVNTSIPVQRIRAIMKLDPDVQVRRTSGEHAR